MNKKNDEEFVIQLSVPGDVHRELKAIAAMFTKNVNELEREAYIIGGKEMIEAYHTGRRGKKRGNHNIVRKRGEIHNEK